MVNVQVINQTNTKLQINKKLLKNCAELVFENKNGEINLILCNDDYLRKLKLEFFNQDEFTDIITFNLEEPGNPVEGEIYISLDRIMENAEIFNQEKEVEINRVFIHGLLHLLGNNDQSEEDKQQMTNYENYYLEKINGPIITFS